MYFFPVLSEICQMVKPEDDALHYRANGWSLSKTFLVSNYRAVSHNVPTLL